MGCKTWTSEELDKELGASMRNLVKWFGAKKCARVLNDVVDTPVGDVDEDTHEVGQMLAKSMGLEHVCERLTDLEEQVDELEKYTTECVPDANEMGDLEQRIQAIEAFLIQMGSFDQFMVEDEDEDGDEEDSVCNACPNGPCDLSED